MAQEHLAHHLDYRKYLINGSKCYYDTMMLLSSGSICQAPNFKSFSEEVSKCLQATVRANNSWNGSRVSRWSEGSQEPEMLATRGVCFLFSAQKASELSKARDREMGEKARGEPILGGDCRSPRERPGKTELGLWHHWDRQEQPKLSCWFGGRIYWPCQPYLLTLPYQPYPLDMKGKRQKGTKRTGKYLPWATRCKRLREFRALCNRSLSVIHFTHSSVYMTVPKSRAHANLLSVMCQPGWSGVGGAGLHVHMAESLLCSPETPTTLLTG